MILGEIQDGKRKVFTKQFEGLNDFYQHCRDGLRNRTAFAKQSSIEGTKGFTGTKDYAEAEQLLINGWSQGAEKLTAQLKVANSTFQNKEVKKAIFDIVGFQASVPRYLQGVPTNMVNKKVEKKKQKVITLVKSITYLGHIGTAQIMDDSIKFLQIVQGIEAKGIRVNVDVFFHAVNSGEEMMIRIPIKKSSERLNLSKMSFPLLHPSFLRRFIFRAMEVESRVRTQWAYGYGQPGGKMQVEALLKPNEYYIPVLISEYDAINIMNKIAK